MEKCVQAIRVVLDMDSENLNLSLEKQLLELKKATACAQFLDDLQTVFNDVNDCVVNCGCIRCTDLIGGNYPYEDEENRDGHGSLKCSDGTMHKVPLNDCLMYKYVKDKCVEFNVPVPNDKIDHPQLYTRSYNLSECLGMPIHPEDANDDLKGADGKMHNSLMSKCSKTKDQCVEFNVPIPNDKIDHTHSSPSSRGGQELLRWLPRIHALSFETQAATVFKMIHAIELQTYADVPASFDDWFRVKGFRL